MFDIYRKNSIKNSERSLRRGETSHQLQHITGAHTHSLTWGSGGSSRLEHS